MPRVVLAAAFLLVWILAHSSFAQQPQPGEGSFQTGPLPRGRGDDKPPPGKAGPRGKMDAADQGPPDGPGRGFGRGGGPQGKGFGGFGPPGGDHFGPPPEDPEMHDLMKQDFDLDRKTHEMAAKVRQARGDERTKLKKDLVDLANKHFDVRQKRRELQLKRMEEELQRLRDAIAKRNDSRETIVSGRVTELVGEERELEF